MTKKRICNICKGDEFLELSTGWKCIECGKIQGKWAIRSITGFVPEGKSKITQKDAQIIRKIRPSLKIRKTINKIKNISLTEEKEGEEWIEIQRRSLK